MKLRDYFSKDFQTSDNHEIETLRTHYYRCLKDKALETVVAMAKEMKCKVKHVDNDRGEIIFDHLDYNACAIITATSYTEMAIDFTILTYNVLPTAPVKKAIEKFYKYLDSKLEFKGTGLYK